MTDILNGHKKTVFSSILSGAGCALLFFFIGKAELAGEYKEKVNANTVAIADYGTRIRSLERNEALSTQAIMDLQESVDALQITVEQLRDDLRKLRYRP